MDLFFTSDALKRKSRKRKKDEYSDNDDNDDSLLRELEEDIARDTTRCEECGGTSFTEDALGTLYVSYSISNQRSII